MTDVVVRRALISVSDKRGLVDFARQLDKSGVEIVSSGGTARHLDQAGIPVTPVETVTGDAAMFGGRVKTLHPNIHGGILADLDDRDHRVDLEERGIAPFQLVVVNLYPFDEQKAIEQIDIGGPAMIRAAAKNHRWVGVVVSPDRYDEVAAAVEAGEFSEELRRSLATDAFARTTAYDAAIASWFAEEKLLRYGENPHQEAHLRADPGADGWWRQADQLHGKEMSFNNYADTEAAWRLAADLSAPAAVIVKHTNPCGAAEAKTLSRAFSEAWDCDPLSAFGGVVALNGELGGDTADLIADYFVEVVIAPSINEAAVEVLADRKNLRLLQAPFPGRGDLDMRRLEGGYLVQERDEITIDGWEVAGTRQPTDAELSDLRFAWIVAAHTKSNAIVVAKDCAAIGVGAGDQSRVGAAERALARAGDRSPGSVAASDGFLPFPDAVELLASAGITAVVEPGGSVKDDAVIEAANDHDLALLFTGRRHFLH